MTTMVHMSPAPYGEDVQPRYGALDAVRGHFELPRQGYQAGRLTSNGSYPYLHPPTAMPAYAAPPPTLSSPVQYGHPHGADCPCTRSPLRITMKQLLAGGRLGIAMKELQVVGFLDRNATKFGWQLGDQVIKVNGVFVHSQNEFTTTLQVALEELKQRRTPLHFDIHRGARPTQGFDQRDVVYPLDNSSSGLPVAQRHRKFKCC